MTKLQENFERAQRLIKGMGVSIDVMVMDMVTQPTSRSNTPTKSRRGSSKKACSVRKQLPPSPRPADDTSTIVQFPAAATK
jgi:hypothetical protein